MSVGRGAADRWQDEVVAALAAAPRALAAARVPAWSRIGGNAATEFWSLVLGAARYFVKAAHLDNAFMLSAEAEALLEMGQTGAVRVPRVIARGEAKRAAFLVLEWLDLVDGGRGAALGGALASLHATTSPRFGWHRDNTIGATLQVNAWEDDWGAFFRDRRLRPQLELAQRNGHGSRLQREGAQLLERVPMLLRGHRPAASLLHGDLWAGNAGALRDGAPVLYDPATYFGDREVDLALSQLFGGFGADFYVAYARAMPLPEGYEMRRTLYNLYHVLNHLNLFGDAYRARSEGMIATLLAIR